MNIQTKPLKVAPNGIVPKVAWTRPRSRAILFARSKDQTLFYTAGGKVEEKETLEQALIRELKEEAQIDLIPDTITLMRVFHGPCHGYVPGTVLEMHCFDADFLGLPTAGREIAELDWFTTRDKHRTTPMGVTILEWFAAQGYID